LAHPCGLTLPNFFSKLSVLEENMSHDKYENVNIVNFNLPLVAPVVTFLETNNNSSEHIASRENSL